MSIIAISGRISSGKDTVGKIIQWLTKPELDGSYIGFQTYDDVTLERLSNWKIKKFAGKLKIIASLLTGISVEKFEDQEFKKVILGKEWGTVKHNPLNAIPAFEDVQFNHLMSVRELLQKLGTEAMRNGLHTNVWVNALFADYTPTDSNWNDSLLKHKPENMLYPNWIITDMRFPNEFQAVKDRGGITIRINRGKTSEEWQKQFPDIKVLDPDGWNRDERYQFEWYEEKITLGEYRNRVMRSTCKFKTSFDTYYKEHESETALDNAEFDYEIINDGSIEDLIEKVREILIKEKII